MNDDVTGRIKAFKAGAALVTLAAVLGAVAWLAVRAMPSPPPPTVPAIQWPSTNTSATAETSSSVVASAPVSIEETSSLEDTWGVQASFDATSVLVSNSSPLLPRTAGPGTQPTPPPPAPTTPGGSVTPPPPPPPPPPGTDPATVTPPPPSKPGHGWGRGRPK